MARKKATTRRRKTARRRKATPKTKTVVRYVSRAAPKRKRRRAVRTVAKRRYLGAKRGVRNVGRKTMTLAQGTAVGVGGAIAAAAAINMMPIVDPRMKAIAQLALGAAAIIAAPRRGQMRKLVPTMGIGAMIAGGTSLTKQLAPGLPLISGDERYSLPPVRRNMAPQSAPASITDINNTPALSANAKFGAVANFVPEKSNLMGTGFKTAANL